MKTKEELQSEISDIKRQIDLKVKYATRALNNDELEKAETLEKEIADLRSRIQEKQEELEKIKEKDDSSEDNPQPVEVNEARSFQNQANINDLGISIQNTKVTSQEVRDFTEYLETRNDIQGGSLKTDSGFVVIPE
ncbi:TPA: phage major capsid protein, partial [Staphylococcus aureus]|nr:phage major capsid protein [Staphylococcus aureus]HEB2341822.1 phage major capsid protein [Staphylococcus aureus]